MTILLFTFLVIGLVIVGMALGVIFSNKPIKGSCGGLNNIGIDGECEICGGNTEKCEEESSKRDEEDSVKKKFDTSLAYNASKKSQN